MPGDSYKSHQTLSSGTSEWNQMDAIIRRVMGDAAHATLVRVTSVDTTKRTVDVQPLVAQIDGGGQATPHGVVHDMPYITLQGGGNAVLIDPVAGDMGLAVFADQDISGAKANKGPAGPGSRRRFSRADGIYVGGVLNAPPTQYVKFASGGVTVKSPTGVTLDTPLTTVTGLSVLQGDVSVVGNVAVSGAISDATGSISGPSATLLLYQRAATSPALPSAAVGYNFTTGAVSGLTNGWLSAPPAPGSNPLWVIQVIAREGAGGSAAVLPVAWTPPQVLAAPGQPGLPGVQTYTWSAFSNSGVSPWPDFTTVTPGVGGINRVYEGIAYNQLTATPSTNPANYVWRKYTGPTAFGLIATGAVVLADTTVISLQAGTGYGTDSAYSGQALLGSAYLSFTAGQTNALFAVGLNSDPTTDNLPTSIDYAWVLAADGTCSITENGTPIASFGSYTTATVFSFKYDGRFVYYYKDSTLERQIASAPSRALFVDSAFYQASRFNNLAFLPAATAGTDGATGPVGPAKQSAVSLGSGGGGSATSVFLAAGAAIAVNAQVQASAGGSGGGSCTTQVQASTGGAGVWSALTGGSASSPNVSTEPITNTITGATWTNTTGAARLFDFRAVSTNFTGRTVDPAQSYMNVGV